MNKGDIYNLDDRGIIYINGDDAPDFLQNIITNDIYKVTDSKSCFASLLTPQGKYLFDFIIIKHKKGFFLDCEKKQIDELFKKLKIYKLKSKVEILNLSNEFVVAAISKEKFLSLENTKEENGFTTKYREDSIVLDPRNKELGGRLFVNLEKLYLSTKKLGLKLCDSNDYYYYSYKLGILQQGTASLQNKIFGIECNFEELNALDFKKGCYVGQENTARIKLKDKLSKKLLPIEILEGSIKIDDEISINNTKIGKIIIGEKYPFGLIKFKDENFNFNKKMNCGSASIKVLRPEWLR
tara:strand:+ start:286 stop:1173 length:888 start_codon:yes stop_codon:yes gene_type:complete